MRKDVDSFHFRIFFLHLLLHISRIHDIKHANDPVDNCKGDGNDGTDEMRHFFVQNTLIWCFNIGIFLLHLLLHISRIHDIKHANDPVDNCEGDGNDGTDEMRHNCCSP